MFINANGGIYNSDHIHYIDYSLYVKSGIISIHFKGGRVVNVKTPESTNIIMTLCPNALEGHEAKYYKNAWMIHNLIGHPLMQLCSMLHLTSLGIKIHDATIPQPK